VSSLGTCSGYLSRDRENGYKIINVDIIYPPTPLECTGTTLGLLSIRSLEPNPQTMEYSEQQAMSLAIRIYMTEYPKEQTGSLYPVPTNVTVRKQLLKGKIKQNIIL